ncbi:MAG TPA: BON domain-containing protein [Terracidiphilus sp.]|nr:BON domain-containing protein [Terracidiphilus sp.]
MTTKSGAELFHFPLRTAAVVAVVAGALMVLPQLSFASGVGRGGAALSEQDAAPQAKAKLNKGQFKDVQVRVDANGIATLTGTVTLYEYKADAQKRVHNVKGVAAVRNMIEVAGPSVSDRELQDKLVEKLSYDRVGYGNLFNAISVRVENGVAILGGHARTDVDKDSAVALVSTQSGVKDVIAEIEVDPVSLMDDQTRMAVARAIYGYPSLNKYAIDPAKPIRIAVQHGNVELYGVVDSQTDKDTAFLRANGVPGIFSVKNYLQVAGAASESAQR